MSVRKVVFYNTLSWKVLYAVFTDSSKSCKVEMKQQSDNLYVCDKIPDGYYGLYFMNENNVRTANTSFNEYCFAFKPNGHKFNGIICLEPYVNRTVSTQTETVSFKFDKKHSKKVHIWTPNTYDCCDCNKKYGVLYMFDGQNLFRNDSTYYGSWNVPQTMELVGDYIVVGIDNSDSMRDVELTPNLGKVEPLFEEDFSNGTGIEFAEFITSEIVPYINSHYNVYSDKKHTAICGASSGGLESFYTGMAYNDIFGFVGALSPAFTFYNENVWNGFLQRLDMDKIPNIYLYSGYSDILEKEIYPMTKKMYELLKKNGCTQNKLVLDCKKENCHNEASWSGALIRFAEMLKLNC